MKLESFKFQDGKVFWLPEYPEEPKWHDLGPRPDTSDYEIRDEQREDYDKAVAQSLASAIEVAPEDRESIRLKVWSKYPDAVLLETGKVYSAECDIEVIKECRGADGKTDWKQTEFEKWQCEPDWIFRKVARLKPKEEIFPAANSHDMKEEEQQELILSEKIVRVKTVCVPAGLIPDKLVRLLYQYSDDKWYGIQVDGHFENIEIWDSNRIYLLKPTHRQVVIK